MMKSFGQTQPSNLDPSHQTHNAVPHSAEAHACGKAIIVGEHAVVYGARAVAIPITTHQFHVRIQPDAHQEATKANKFYLGEKMVPQHVADVWQDAMTLLGIKGTSFVIRGKSTLPVGAGLGSSATLCVAALRSLAVAFNLRLSSDEVAAYANKLEERFHGRPSGLDTSVVAHEKAILFRKGRGASPIRVDGTWRFALVDSGVRASTLAMIRLAAPFFGGAEGEKRIAAFDALTMQVCAGLESNDELAVAQGMREASDLLEQAGVVSNDLKEIITQCQSLGVPAAKSTGAGGGGAVIALLSRKHYEEQYQEIIEHFGPERVFKVTLEAGYAD